MPMSISLTVLGETIGRSLAEDMEEAACAFGAFADGTNDGDMDDLVDRLSDNVNSTALRKLAKAFNRAVDAA